MFEHVFCPIVAHVLVVMKFQYCAICMSKIYLAPWTMLGPRGWRYLLNNHLLTYGMMFVDREVCALLYSSCMYVLRLHRSCRVG